MQIFQYWGISVLYNCISITSPLIMFRQKESKNQIEPNEPTCESETVICSSSCEIGVPFHPHLSILQKSGITRSNRKANSQGTANFLYIITSAIHCNISDFYGKGVLFDCYHFNIMIQIFLCVEASLLNLYIALRLQCI